MIWINVDRNSSVTLIRQLYDKIRNGILNGELRAGYKLPSTRELSKNLGISRNVVLEAYDMLAAEGYIDGVRGSGMYVAQNASFEGYKDTCDMDLFGKQTPAVEDNGVIYFRSGLPALDLFPIKSWSNIMKNSCMGIPASVLSYGESAGCTGLRDTLAQYLLRVRGVRCKPDNIIITTGAVQALKLTAQLLLSPGDEVLLEEPSNYDLRKILSSTGAGVIPVPVDEHGMRTQLLPEDKGVKLVYVTPSHQFPLGGILPIQRRIELIRYSRNKECYVIEDDYDSEFRYEGPPVSSLQSLDPHRVIYVGTFSKIMFPAIRIGYMVLPDKLVGKCCRLKRHSDFQTPIIEQLALASFIDGGLLERHISRMKKVYHKRQQRLIKCLEAAFPGQFTVLGKSTGLHVVVEFKFKVTNNMLGSLKKHRIRIFPVDVHSISRGSHANKFIFGYGNLTEEEIDEGVRRIKEAFQ